MYLTIETDRLQLRRIEIDDAPFLFRLMNSPGWLTFIGDRNISGLDAARAYIVKMNKKKHHYYHLFEKRDSLKPVGVLTLLKRDGETHHDIGFALLPEFEGQGFALEASKAYLKQIKNLGMHKQILAITLAHNKRSIGLLMKLGLHFIGTRIKHGETLNYYGTTDEAVY